MKNFPGINASIIDGEVERKYWSLVDYYLRELTRGTAKTIDDVNSPGLSTDPGGTLANFLYLPGRTGGQTVRVLEHSGGTGIRIIGAGDVLSGSAPLLDVQSSQGSILTVRSGAAPAVSIIPQGFLGTVLSLDISGHWRITENAGTVELTTSSASTVLNCASSGLTISTGASGVFTGRQTISNGDGAQRALEVRAATVQSTDIQRWTTSSSTLLAAISSTGAYQLVAGAGANKVLTSDGSGVGSWQTLPGSFTGFANPTGLINLTPTNGVATTAMRSDAAPALDPAINPTWSGTHTFNNEISLALGANFNSQSAPGSPASGDVWNDSTQKALIAYPKGVKQTLDGTLFTQTASRTWANDANVNTLLNTGIGSLTVPANWWAPGKTLMLLVDGYYGCLANATMRLKVNLTDTTPTTVTVADTGAPSGSISTLPTAATNRAFSLAVLITCRTTGSTGTGFAQMLTYFEKNANYDQTPNTGTFTFDTTKANTIDLTEDWGTASGTNTITVSNAVLKVVN